MKKFLVIGLLFLLPSCASIQKFNSDVNTVVTTAVSPDTLDTIEAGYGSALAIAVGYRNLCERKVIHKSCWVTIAQLQPYERKAYNAYIVLKNFVRKNPNADATSFFQIAKDAIFAFKSAETKMGVK